MTESIDDLKAQARRAAFAARKVAHVRGTGSAEAARDIFLAAGFAEGAAVIAGYRPIRTEIDPTPLMTDLHLSGHRLVVPVIVEQGRPLEFREWWPGVRMTTGAFGAEIPVDTHALIPDLLLVPLLAFDRHGYRLGYGGGFYDRTLAALEAERPVRAYGVAYAAQEIPAVPTDRTDQRLDGVVTERELIEVGR